MTDGKGNYTKTGGLEGSGVHILSHVLIGDSNVMLTTNVMISKS